MPTKEARTESTVVTVAKTERIAAAAIRQDGVVYTGPHHCQIIRQIVGCGGRRPVTGEQGFVTSKNRFVLRPEARRIARAAAQLPRLSCHQTDLFSEDLWSVPDREFVLEKKLTALREHLDLCPPAIEADFAGDLKPGADGTKGVYGPDDMIGGESSAAALTKAKQWKAFNARHPALNRWLDGLAKLLSQEEVFTAHVREEKTPATL